MERTRILIADDHVLVAEAFKNLLEPEYHVVGVVTDGKSLIRVALETKPDIVLLDLGMPVLNGLDAGQELKKLLPRIKLIILTMNEDPEIASKALQHWASSYLLKKIREHRACTGNYRGFAWALLCNPNDGAEANGRVHSQPTSCARQGADTTTASSPAVAGGGQLHERGCRRTQHRRANHRLS